MKLKRAKTSSVLVQDESQSLTSDDHQSLTTDDLDFLNQQETVAVADGVDTVRASTRRVRPLPPVEDHSDFETADDWSPPQHSAIHRSLKRLTDVVVSAVALILVSPIVLLISAAIFLSDFGPIFYLQARVGQGGRQFRFCKFRTMVRNAEALQAGLIEKNHFQGDVTFKLTNDPRVTRVGRFLRKTSLDELPQLWHVLAGQMSLVGPRPPVPSEVAEYSPYELRRVSVRPGLTCLWQVSGRSDLPFERQVELDLEYIENESLWLDAVLLIRTVPALVMMKGAY